MANLPLIRHPSAQAPFAIRGGQQIDAGRFLDEVHQVAARLPARRYVLNLCTDRYRFVAGFAAALVRKQISLLPPNHTPELLAQVARQYGDVYCLTDDATVRGAIETVAYPEIVPAAAEPVLPAFPAKQVAAHVFTSGSTGQPVPHVKTWGSLVNGTKAAADGFGLHALSGASLLGMVPPQHMFGFESTVMLPMQQGLVLHAGRPFYPADICACIEALPRPRVLITTPIHLRALLADKAPLPPADLMVCATAPLAPQLAVEAEARFGAPLYEIYGCTEAGQVALRRTAQTGEWRCLEGIALHRDKRGTWAKGGPVEVEALLNDVIELRNDGRFLLHGRLGDMVNIAGKRTSLAHLNYHLNSIEGVLDGVFVMPEEAKEGVTRLMAFVVAPGLSPQAILNALRERVDAAFLPRPLHFIEALPRNATGKLPRETVTRLALEFAERPVG